MQSGKVSEKEQKLYLEVYDIFNNLIESEAFINFAKLCNIEVTNNIGLISKYKTNGVSLENITNYLRKYKFNELLKKENISLENEDWIGRYKIRLQSLANISEGRNVNSKVSVTVSNIMNEYINN